jgi:hypothetical protein
MIKKLLLTATVSLLCMSSYGQDTLTYNRQNLAPMGKVALTKIYIQQMDHLFATVVSLPLSNAKGNVPDNRYVQGLWKNINKSTYVSSKGLRENAGDLLPYADKDRLIDSILFMQDMLNSMDKMRK